MRRVLDNIRGHHFYNCLGPDSVVVDLGAYRGDFACRISEKYGCRVYAVEASPDAFEQLPMSDLVSKHHYVVSNQTGRVRFYPGTNPEGSSIFSSHKHATNQWVDVGSITLVEFMGRQGIDHIDLLKLDIEGAEVDLLEDLDLEVLQRIDQITVEFHDFMQELNIVGRVRAVKKRLHKLAFFTLVCMRPNKDVLFVNRSTNKIPLLRLIWDVTRYRVYTLISRSPWVNAQVIALVRRWGLFL